MELKPNAECNLVVTHKPSIAYPERNETVTVKLTHLGGKAISPAPENKLSFKAVATKFPVPVPNISFTKPSIMGADKSELVNENGVYVVPVGTSIVFHYKVVNNTRSPIWIDDFRLPEGWSLLYNECKPRAGIAAGKECVLQLDRQPSDTMVQTLDETKIMFDYQYQTPDNKWQKTNGVLGKELRKTAGYHLKPELEVKFNGPSEIGAAKVVTEGDLYGVAVGKTIVLHYIVTNTSKTLKIKVDNFKLPAGWEWQANYCNKELAPQENCILQIKRTLRDTTIQTLDEKSVDVSYQYEQRDKKWIQASTKLGNAKREVVGYANPDFHMKVTSSNLTMTNVGDSVPFEFYATGYRPKSGDGWEPRTQNGDAEIKVDTSNACQLTTLRNQRSRTCAGTVTRTRITGGPGTVKFGAGWVFNNHWNEIGDNWRNMYLENKSKPVPVINKADIVIRNIVLYGMYGNYMSIDEQYKGSGFYDIWHGNSTRYAKYATLTLRNYNFVGITISGSGYGTMNSDIVRPLDKIKHTFADCLDVVMLDAEPHDRHEPDASKLEPFVGCKNWTIPAKGMCQVVVRFIYPQRASCDLNIIKWDWEQFLIVNNNGRQILDVHPRHGITEFRLRQ